MGGVEDEGPLSRRVGGTGGAAGAAGAGSTAPLPLGEGQDRETALLLESVCVLDVLPHGAWVRVALPTPGIPAGVRLTRDVRLLVLGTIACVVEFLCAAWKVALVRFFPRVCPGVQLQVLQAREAPQARHYLALVGLLSGVAAEVSDQFVASIEGFELTGAILPQTHKLGHGQRVRPV